MKKVKIFRTLKDALKNPGEVEALTLYKPGMIMDEIGTLINLKFLSIVHSEIETLPVSFGELTQLENLALYDNKLTGLPDLSRLSRLSGLDLSNNCFRSIPEWLAGLPALARLDLRGNPELKNLPELFFDFIKEVLLEEEKYPPARLRKKTEKDRAAPRGLFESILSDKEYDYLVLSKRSKDIYLV